MSVGRALVADVSGDGGGIAEGRDPRVPGDGNVFGVVRRRAKLTEVCPKQLLLPS